VDPNREQQAVEFISPQIFFFSSRDSFLSPLCVKMGFEEWKLQDI
jgi:hypothetical protein